MVPLLSKIESKNRTQIPTCTVRLLVPIRVVIYQRKKLNPVLYNFVTVLGACSVGQRSPTYVVEVLLQYLRAHAGRGRCGLSYGVYQQVRHSRGAKYGRVAVLKNSYLRVDPVITYVRYSQRYKKNFLLYTCWYYQYRLSEHVSSRERQSR